MAKAMAQHWPLTVEEQGAGLEEGLGEDEEGITTQLLLLSQPHRLPEASGLPALLASWHTGYCLPSMVTVACAAADTAIRAAISTAAAALNPACFIVIVEGDADVNQTAGLAMT
jgi:hypothetical protein